MNKRKISAIVLAAGQGTRMKSDLPKVMHKIGNWPLIRHVRHALIPLDLQQVVLVLAPSMPQVAKEAQPCAVAYQEQALGTAHAVKSAANLFASDDSDILILYGDTPFISTQRLAQLIARRQEQDEPALVLMGMRPKSPKGYGRYILNDDGYVERIVEERDATEEEKRIELCNGGVMIADGKVLWSWLEEIKPNNTKGEYYLTDLVAIANKKGRKVAHLEVSEQEVLGINDRNELANAEQLFQKKRREEIMVGGVTLLDPASTYFSADTEIGQDTVIGPHVFLGLGVKIRRNVEIRAFSHLEGVEVMPYAQIGPFARLRPGTKIAEEVHIGNFVEVKNSLIERGAKANHLSYLGDSKIGARTNIGAGTITCNYDGFKKSTTEIGAEVFVGSNTALVAPIKIGDGAIIAAGSVITQNVEAGELAIARAKQEHKLGWAERFRQWRKK